ncbi:MAG: hydantoinase [Methanosarcinales archaeon]|nr:hydantoinase [Methanosarcinales archaeon]
MILGLDIGGANTKLAGSRGEIRESIYLPLWKEAPLARILQSVAERTSPQAVGVVMTGELADCYPSKKDGVLSIKSAVEGAFDCPCHFWGVGGFGWTDLLDLAAANWSASAALIAGEVGDCIFVDMGSTTTDLIPIRGRPQAALTDFGRLVRGELVYSGLLRTNLATLLRRVEIGGSWVPLSSELFAISADACLALGEIPADGYACDAPDNAPRTREASLRRLARTVCADLSEIGEDGALAIARQARWRQQKILRLALERQAGAWGLDLVVAAGIGEARIVEACRDPDLSCRPLSSIYDRSLSGIFPAFAVARLLERDLAGGI